MPPEFLADWLSALRQNPPFYFEPPDLDPGAEIIQDYLEDLTRLAIEAPPYTSQARDLVKETAHFLRMAMGRVRA